MHALQKTYTCTAFPLMTEPTILRDIMTLTQKFRRVIINACFAKELHLYSIPTESKILRDMTFTQKFTRVFFFQKVTEQKITTTIN